LFPFNFYLNLHKILKAEKITYQPKINFYIIAIASVLKDYRMSFFLNQELHLGLEKDDDFISKNKKKESAKKLGKFYFFDKNSEFEYYLIQNKLPGTVYIKTLKNFDFLFIIKTIDEESIDISSFTEKIKTIDDVQLVYEINQLKPSEQNLIEKDF